MRPNAASWLVCLALCALCSCMDDEGFLACVRAEGDGPLSACTGKGAGAGGLQVLRSDIRDLTREELQELLPSLGPRRLDMLASQDPWLDLPLHGFYYARSDTDIDSHGFFAQDGGVTVQVTPRRKRSRASSAQLEEDVALEGATVVMDLNGETIPVQGRLEYGSPFVFTMGGAWKLMAEGSNRLSLTVEKEGAEIHYEEAVFIVLTCSRGEAGCPEQDLTGFKSSQTHNSTHVSVTSMGRRVSFWTDERGRVDHFQRSRANKLFPADGHGANLEDAGRFVPGSSGGPRRERGTRVHVRVEEFVGLRCEYMVMLAPTVLHAGFAHQVRTGDDEKGTTWLYEHSAEVCHTGPLTLFVVVIGCDSNMQAPFETGWPHVLAAADVHTTCEGEEGSPWVQEQRNGDAEWCTGDAMGAWVLDDANLVTGYKWVDAGNDGMPIVAELLKKGKERSHVAVYGQYMLWRFPSDKARVAELGSEPMTSLGLRYNPDQYSWRPHTPCIWRDMHEGALLSERAGLKRIAIAGTSRSRALFDTLQKAFRVPNFKREKLAHMFPRHAVSESGGVQLDYFVLHGSVHYEFREHTQHLDASQQLSMGKLRCAAAAERLLQQLLDNGYCSHTCRSDDCSRAPEEAVVLSFGLYETLWGNEKLFPACARTLLRAVQQACGNTSTRVIYKTEEAGTGREADRTLLWQYRIRRANKAACVAATELGIDVLDAHAFTLARSDATIDGYHYWDFGLREELVGNATRMARFVENRVARVVAAALMQTIVRRLGPPAAG